jgi:uncharacterized membrane protein
MPEIAERLQAAQAKVKQFAGVRDQLMRDIGAEDQKLEEIYSKMKELGVENPESLSAEQVQAMVVEEQEVLTTKLAEIEAYLAQGETLINKYQEMQSNG